MNISRWQKFLPSQVSVYFENHWIRIKYVGKSEGIKP